MRSATRWRLGSLVAVALVGVGCTERDEEVRAETDAPVELSPMGEPGSDRSPFPVEHGTGTGDGDDLVVISPNYGPGPYEAALRRADGTWWELPPVPFDGHVQLATAGDRAVAGGVACAGWRCSDGELAFAILAEDRSGWVRLDAPDVALSPTNTEITTSPDLGPFARFSIGTETYSVDERGDVDAWSPMSTVGPPGSVEHGCYVEDTYVSVHLNLGVPSESGEPTWPRIVGDVHVQQVSDSTPPTSVGPVPPGPATPTYFCAGGDLIIDDGVAQGSFDVASGSWESGPSNLADVGGFVSISPITGRLATSPDGSTAFLVSTNAGVLRRTTPGAWNPTGAFGHVFTTGVSVLVIAHDDQTVTEVWPESSDANGAASG